ncbi:MAG: anti-sigma factor [Candidatus Neomarinimicrobiota bacterium]|nr:MAG: anti-sigma factor [Candidatus Neomarinimicrobiota bacterium]
MKEQESNKEKMIRLVEEYLGEDYDREVMEDIRRYMEECPECKVYIDSVRDTIKLYRVTREETTIPSDVSQRLFKKLNLNRFRT